MASGRVIGPPGAATRMVTRPGLQLLSEDRGRAFRCSLLAVTGTWIPTVQREFQRDSERSPAIGGRDEASTTRAPPTIEVASSKPKLLAPSTGSTGSVVRRMLPGAKALPARSLRGPPSTTS